MSLFLKDAHLALSAAIVPCGHKTTILGVSGTHAMFRREKSLRDNEASPELRPGCDWPIGFAFASQVKVIQNMAQQV
ncbi:hypothetical protein [Paracoccus alkenifer]|uniref:hypothetical protein n=1 Tax=Paracoccus alkenifer TaxID=65735 RepID=UPI00115FA73C|nr:hypothetical protein [Paracoccus alkenifer]